ncbi:transcriptional regulator TbsP domain-containing protein [Salinibaculum rarum]|uniref:transcriptional regulator TbsP domain-containing protein n=1 Tax=Salinibaculum rarum TaxID=3058903 RepID=UPI00265EA321|nr:DUF5821 family protein [Salinibaculum sp. KK48]
MESVHTSPLRAGVRHVQHTTAGDRYIVTVDTGFLNAICGELAATVRERTGTFHILSTERALNKCLPGGPRTTRVADEIPDRARLYTVDTVPAEMTPVVTTQDDAALVSILESDIGVEIVSTTYADVIREHVEDLVDEATQFHVDTPSESTIRETATDTFGVGFTTDVNTAFLQAEIYEDNSPQEAPDPLSVLVLVAARNQVKKKPFANWCAQIGFATERTTYTRFKTLHDCGLIREEKTSAAGKGGSSTRVYLADEFTQLDPSEYPEAVTAYTDNTVV